MIVSVGRAVLFVNMTQGKSYFRGLSEHNLSQARNRLLEWRQGRPIRGKNEYSSFAVEWDDVDVIHLISVVDGPHAACIGHSLAEVDMNAKVRLATTLTSGALRQLAVLGGGARDLISFCEQLSTQTETSTQQAIQELRDRHDGLLASARAGTLREPTRLGKGIIGGKPVSFFDEFRVSFENLRRQEGAELDLFSDLSWNDVFTATAFIEDVTAEIEWLDHGCVVVAVLGGEYPFMVVVSSNGDELLARAPEIDSRARRSGCRFLYTVMLTPLGPMSTIAIWRTGRWATVDQLANSS